MSDGLRVTANASELRETERYCTCCERRLARRFAYLERDIRTGHYHDRGDIPEEHSQGWFPFGLTCARNLKAASHKPDMGTT